VTRGFGLSEQFDTAIERVKRDCAITASQMRCPRHFKDAKVEVERGSSDVLYIDICTCCEEFETCVRKALRKNLDVASHEFLFEGEGSEKTRLPRGSRGSSHGSDRNAVWL